MLKASRKKLFTTLVGFGIVSVYQKGHKMKTLYKTINFVNKTFQYETTMVAAAVLTTTAVIVFGLNPVTIVATVLVPVVVGAGAYVCGI